MQSKYFLLWTKNMTTGKWEIVTTNDAAIIETEACYESISHCRGTSVTSSLQFFVEELFIMSLDLQHLGKYELQESLVRTGVAEAWKAFDPQLQRYVTLKVFHADLQKDPDFMTRFWSLPMASEAQKALALHHPNIVQIHGFQICRSPASENPLAYMVIDYIEGPTLADHIRNTSYEEFASAADIVHLFASIAAAIDHAHQKGVIHGNLKPTNILLDEHNTSRNPMGEPMLTDIGMTRLLGISTAALIHWEPDTSFYISPEQAQGYPGNKSSDLYALGVILYEICTGAKPFQGDSPAAVMAQQINTMPPSPDLINPNISSALSAIILRSLAKDPEDRFPSAASMVTALAKALNIAVPEVLSQPLDTTNTMNEQINMSQAQFTLPPSLAPSETLQPSHPVAQPSWQPTVSVSREQAIPMIPPGSFSEAPSFASSTSSLPSILWPRLQGATPPASPSPRTSIPLPPLGPLSDRRLKGPLMRNLRFAFLLILIILLLASTLGALLVLTHKNASTPSTPPVVGHVYFVSSWQLYSNNNQGINDEVLIDLHNIPVPSPGKSYYAWLLGDKNLSEVPWVLLGKVSINRGNLHFLYPGDLAHTNLFTDMSRFLLTEDDERTTPTNPLLDQSTWRYEGEIYQTPSPKDVNHFSMLDHLRHLLVQAPELKALDLPGGLSVWLMRNTQEISKWALSAKERWETNDTVFIRQQLVNILYYLDGECTQTDLQGVPPGTPTAAQNETIAHIAHFALLNSCIQEEQEQANLLKQVFQHTPHNYIDHTLFHIAGVIQSPGATPNVHALALEINVAVNNVKHWLAQVHQDAVQLLHMTDLQLIQLSALAMLGHLETMARYAYAGQTDPATGSVQEGATWIYDNVERLATFDVTAYS